MPMQLYNRHTVFNKRGKPPVIRLDASMQNARITFSVEAVRLLNFKKGDCLTFFTMKEETDIIYFYVDNKNGIPMKQEEGLKSGVRMGVYCRELARNLVKHFGINGSRSFILSDVTINFAEQKCFFIDKHKPYAGRYKPNSKIN
jgi:hypothetical protein